MAEATGSRNWLASTGPAGWFGKISCLGDFGSRRMPPELKHACDEWLSNGVAHSKDQLGDRWLDTYLTAPVWRFAWAPGVINPQWWMGALMPSVDNVGRYFPLLVVKPAAAPPTTARGLAQLELWFEQVVAAMLATLDPNATVDSFDSALAELPDWGEAGGLQLPAIQHLAQRERYESAEGASMSAWLPRVTAAVWLDELHGCSLWWPVRRGATQTALSVTRSLPASERFVELLEASW